MKEKKLFLILFCLALVLLVLDKKGDLIGIKGKAEQAVNPVRVRLYSWIRERVKMVEKVKKEERGEEIEKVEKRLSTCQYDFKNLKKENEDLRRLLQAPLPKDWSFIPAGVLGKKRYLLIDQGEEAGVKKGMTVVFEKFLVGRVAETSPFSASILLPFDSESKISVKTEGGARGLLEGRFGSRLFLTKVLQKETLNLDEWVVTSGEDGYQLGVLIGKIKNKEPESEKPFQEAEVEPGLEYEGVERVFVVKE